jgi:hypothetical protein
MSHTPRDEIKNILREYFSQRLENEFDQTDPVKIDEFVVPKVEELLSKFEESVLSREIREEIKTSKPWFLTGVLQSIVGGLAIFLMLGLTVLILHGSRFDFWKTIETFARDMNTKSTIEQELDSQEDLSN